MTRSPDKPKDTTDRPTVGRITFGPLRERDRQAIRRPLKPRKPLKRRPPAESDHVVVRGQRCPACDGKGGIGHRQPCGYIECPACQGSGWMEERA